MRIWEKILENEEVKKLELERLGEKAREALKKKQSPGRKPKVSGKILGVVAAVLFHEVGKIKEWGLKKKIIDRDEEFYKKFTEEDLLGPPLEKEEKKVEKALSSLEEMGIQIKGEDSSVEYKIACNFLQPLLIEMIKNKDRYGEVLREEIFDNREWKEVFNKREDISLRAISSDVEFFSKFSKGEEIEKISVDRFYYFILLVTLTRDLAETLFRFSYYPKWVKRVKDYLKDLWRVEIEEVPLVFSQRWRFSWNPKTERLHFLPFSKKSIFFSGMGEEISHSLLKDTEYGLDKLDRLFSEGEVLSKAKEFFEENKSTIHTFVHEFFGGIGKLYVLDRENLEGEFEHQLENLGGLTKTARKVSSWVYFKRRYKDVISNKMENEFDNDLEAYRQYLLEKVREEISERRAELIRGDNVIKELLKSLKEGFYRIRSYGWSERRKDAAQHISQEKVANNYELIKNMDPRLRRNLIKMPMIYSYFFIRFFPFRNFSKAIEEFSENPVGFFKKHLKEISKAEEIPEEVKEILKSEEFENIVKSKDYIYFLSERKFQGAVLKEVKEKIGADLRKYF